MTFEINGERAKVWGSCKRIFVDTHENENRVLSAEDSATDERMEAEIEGDLTRRLTPPARSRNGKRPEPAR